MSQKIAKTIVITGTHLTPAVELIRQLKADSKISWSIVYVGRKFNSSDSNQRPIESKIIPELKITYYGIDCGKFDRKYFPNTIKGMSKTIKGFFQSKKIIKKTKPDIVVSFGGYVSVPIIINSYLKKIPSITHEQTSTNSLTTKINSFFVNKVALSFNNPSQIKHLPQDKIVVTGNLIRHELFTQNNKLPSIKKISNPILYITAGNQGSHSINLLIKQLLPELNHYTIIHQTGQVDFPIFKRLISKYKNYYPFPYIETKYIGWVLNQSSLIISRSGANTSQEIVSFSKKSILIPLPKSQQNEQVINANWVKQQLPQQTTIIPQSQLDRKTLLDSINLLAKKPTPKSKKPTSVNLELLKLIHEVI